MGILKGRIALVTGGSRGIGRASAIALARAGCDVAVNYREMEEKARSVVEQIVEIGCRAIMVQADVSLNTEVTQMVKRVEDELGAIEILINNAGISRPRSVDDITEADWDETMAINLKSAFLVTQAVIPSMRKRQWGRIVNITSGAAHAGGIVGPHYNASKAGMEGLTRAYADRLVKEGVTVNSVAPSLIETDMTKHHHSLFKHLPMGRIGQASEVAEAVVFASSNAYMTGQTIPLNGGRYFR